MTAVQVTAVIMLGLVAIAGGLLLLYSLKKDNEGGNDYSWGIWIGSCVAILCVLAIGRIAGIQISL